MTKDRRIQKAFGLAVRELREEQGLSQEMLATKGGFHRTYISKIERGQVTVRFITVLRLAEAFQISFTEFTCRFVSHMDSL